MGINPDTVLVSPIFGGKRVKSVFTLAGERTDENPLGNNMSTVDSVILSGLKLVGVPDEDLDREVAREIKNVLRRRAELSEYLGIEPPYAIASPKPVHGANFVDISRKTIADLQLDSPNRIEADIAYLLVPGYGSLIAPADCPVIDIVDTGVSETVVQIHAGWQGILKGAVTSTMKRMRRIGFNPAKTLAHVHPNATHGFELSDDALARWKAEFGGDFIEVNDGKSYISMTGAVIAQMEEAGIPSDQINTSAVFNDGVDLNSLTNDQFYSHRAQGAKGFNGRNAAVLVRVND